MGRFQRIQRLQRWAPVEIGLATQRRATELGGWFLASAVTLSVIIATIPLLLVIVAVIGFVSAGSDDVAAQIIDQLGIRGQLARIVEDALAAAEQGRAGATIIGLLGVLWASLRIAAAIEYVCNRAWQVPSRGPMGRLLGLGWIGAAVVLVGVSMAAASLLGILPLWAAPLQVLAALALLAGFFLFTFQILTTASVPVRAHVPGALVMATGFHLLTVLATVVVPALVASRSALYGSIGALFAVIAYLLLFGRLLVYCVVLDVVCWERTHGTVHVEVEAPRLDGEVPVAADRSAAIQR